MGSLDVKKLEVENLRVAGTRPATEADQVDVALEIWGARLPDLDLDIEGDRDADLEARAARRRHDAGDPRRVRLSHGEYKLMMYLRYGGPPYRGKPGKLAKHLGLSTGAMTNRLDNMERRGPSGGSTTPTIGVA